MRATKEVQLAAQQVDTENRLLRWLLKTRFGVNAGQISKFLSGLNCPIDSYMQSSAPSVDGIDMSRVSGESASSLTSTMKPAKVVRQRATQVSPCSAPMSSREERQQGVGIGSESPGYQFTSPITSLAGIGALQSGQATSQIHPSNRGPQRTLQTPPTQFRIHEDQYGTELDHCCATSDKASDSCAGETPCEEAARIIESLRGQNTHSDVWSELGCGTNQSCRVKNLSVFELMDME